MFLLYRSEKDLTKAMYADGRRGLTPNEQGGGLSNLQLFLCLPQYITFRPYSIPINSSPQSTHLVSPNPNTCLIPSLHLKPSPRSLTAPFPIHPFSLLKCSVPFHTDKATDDLHITKPDFCFPFSLKMSAVSHADQTLPSSRSSLHVRSTSLPLPITLPLSCLKLRHSTGLCSVLTRRRYNCLLSIHHLACPPAPQSIQTRTLHLLPSS